MDAGRAGRGLAGSSAPTLLVVDDIAANIALMAEVLGGQYKVQVATSGERALELCASGPVPSLILLDVMMPGLSGFEVCRRLKDDPRTAEVPVILVTALAEPSDETRGFEAGAVDYVTKPISPAVVLQRVRLHLELREARRRLERLSGHLSAYLPPELSASIRRGEVAQRVGSQRKTLTVFLSDLQGFTHRTEQLGPEDMTVLLNAYFEDMTAIVRRYGGTLDKYIGDAILVFFGDPESRGEAADALACAKMALEMQSRLPALNVAWRRFGLGEDLAIRVGIATGPCTVGNFGSSDQLTYTVLGTAVNLAARLQSHCPPGRVLVSEATWALVAGSLPGEGLPPIDIKGLSRPARTWLLDPAHDPSTPVGESAWTRTAGG